MPTSTLGINLGGSRLLAILGWFQPLWNDVKPIVYVLVGIMVAFWIFEEILDWYRVRKAHAEIRALESSLSPEALAAVREKVAVKKLAEREKELYEMLMEEEHEI